MTAALTILILTLIAILFSRMPRWLRGIIAGVLAIVVLGIFALRDQDECERREQ